MNVTTNLVLASRRRKQAALFSMAGLSVLIAGLVINLRAARGGASQQLLVAYGALIIGALLSWTGVVLSDRWAARPRADEALETGLKGAGPAYRLYNWCLPADHVLLAPWGLVVFTVFNNEGPIAIRGRRWRERRSLLSRALSLGRRRVRDPGHLLEMEKSGLARALLARDGEIGDVAIDGVAVFAHPRASIVADDPSVPAIPVAAMREWLRGQARRPTLAIGERRRVERALDAIAKESLDASAGDKRAR